VTFIPTKREAHAGLFGKVEDAVLLVVDGDPEDDDAVAHLLREVVELRERDLQGLNRQRKISLESAPRKIAIVDFWARVWPCKISFPKLDDLAKKMATAFVVLGISVDDKKDGILDFAKETGVSFPLGWDEGHTPSPGAGASRRCRRPSSSIRRGRSASSTTVHDGEAGLMGKELAGLLDEPSDGNTKVAKADDTSKSSTTRPSLTRRIRRRSDSSKTDAKTDDRRSRSADPTAASVADGTPFRPPRRRLEEGREEGRTRAGKKAPPKKTKKKKPAGDSTTAPTLRFGSGLGAEAATSPHMAIYPRDQFGRKRKIGSTSAA